MDEKQCGRKSMIEGDMHKWRATAAGGTNWQRKNLVTGIGGDWALVSAEVRLASMISYRISI